VLFSWSARLHPVTYGHNTIAIFVYNTTQCVQSNGEDLSCYSNKIESVGLRKCPYDQWLTNKAYLSTTTVANISQSFTYKMAAKVNWHRYGTKLRHCHLTYTPRGRKKQTLFFCLHPFNARQKLVIFFTHIKESTIYNSMHLILASVVV